MDEKAKIESQLRAIRGQMALAKWEGRLKILEEDCDQFAAWLEGSEDLENPDKSLGDATHHIAAALESLDRALTVAKVRVDALQEFAQKKRGER